VLEEMVVPLLQAHHLLETIHLLLALLLLAVETPLVNR
jgi:hypothetical protein